MCVCVCVCVQLLASLCPLRASSSLLTPVHFRWVRANVCTNVFQIGVTRIIIPREYKAVLKAARTYGGKRGGKRQRTQGKLSRLNDKEIQIFLSSINKLVSRHIKLHNCKICVLGMQTYILCRYRLAQKSPYNWHSDHLVVGKEV